MFYREQKRNKTGISRDEDGKRASFMKTWG
jgi:hypothetical protein